MATYCMTKAYNTVIRAAKVLGFGIRLASGLRLGFGYEFSGVFSQYYSELIHPRNITVMRKQLGPMNFTSYK